jgi:hypothetical protein
MLGKVVTGVVITGLVALAALPPSAAWALPCVRACTSQIAACGQAQCQGMSRRATKRCKRTCKKSIMLDCYRDLTVCGATSARPVSSKPTSGGTHMPSMPGGW